MHWDFAFDRTARLVLAPLGVRPATARVRMTAGEFAVDFGPWHLRTAVDNISGAVLAGPYTWLKVVGPHLSMADRGVTFGTNARAGVCIRFVEPVPALFPGRVVKHPGVTVTVADPVSLLASLETHSKTRHRSD